MLNLVQHLTKSMTYETLKQVQGDKLGLFTRPSVLDLLRISNFAREALDGDGREKGGVAE